MSVPDILRGSHSTLSSSPLTKRIIISMISVSDTSETPPLRRLVWRRSKPVEIQTGLEVLSEQ